MYVRTDFNWNLSILLYLGIIRTCAMLELSVSSANFMCGMFFVANVCPEISCCLRRKCVGTLYTFSMLIVFILIFSYLFQHVSIYIHHIHTLTLYPQLYECYRTSVYQRRRLFYYKQNILKLTFCATVILSILHLPYYLTKQYANFR